MVLGLVDVSLILNLNICSNNVLWTFFDDPPNDLQLASDNGEERGIACILDAFIHHVKVSVHFEDVPHENKVPRSVYLAHRLMFLIYDRHILRSKNAFDHHLLDCWVPLRVVLHSGQGLKQKNTAWLFNRNYDFVSGVLLTTMEDISIALGVNQFKSSIIY